MKRFVVFDIDWTLHPSALGTEFLKALSDAGHTTRNLQREYDEWRTTENRGNYFLEHFVPVYESGIRRIQRSEMERIGQHVASTALAAIYPVLREEIDWCKSLQLHIVAISSSPAIATEPFTKLLGFNGCISPTFLFDENGYYIGPKHRSDKEKDKGLVLSHYVTDKKLEWKDSRAYGDSLDDLPMLELVEYPVVVNPSDNLRAVAIERGWRILEP